jgi:hypothetical protein
MTTTYGVWEGHKTVAGLNQLMGSTILLLINVSPTTLHVCPINMKETLSSFFPLDNENITK